MEKIVLESLKDYNINEAAKEVYFLISHEENYIIEDKNKNIIYNDSKANILYSLMKICDISKFEAMAILRDVDKKGKTSILISPYRLNMM